MKSLFHHPIFLIAIWMEFGSSLFQWNSWAIQLYAQDTKPVSSNALIVIGAGGTDEYLDDFQSWANRWQKVFPESVQTEVYLPNAPDADKLPTDDRQRLLDWIAKPIESPDSERWLILIGHGTYQSRVAKFNLEGPDISVDELVKSIAVNPARWRIFVCASCSSPFLNGLSGPNRIIVTATKSGSEQNLSRFGDYFSQSIGDSKSDLDHDGNVSILEAFLTASGQLSKWYADEGRIASEQSLIDDNGDQRGTPANFFKGVRAIKAPAEGTKLDGPLSNRTYVVKPSELAALTAEQQAKVSDIEQQIEGLRLRKADLDEEIYFSQLEEYLLEMAKLLRL